MRFIDIATRAAACAAAVVLVATASIYASSSGEEAGTLSPYEGLRFADVERVAATGAARSYVVVDTGQDECYGNEGWIVWPDEGEPFHGQDAQYDGPQPSYTDNGDGTVKDENTGLQWQQTPDFVKRTWEDSVDYCTQLELADHDDWMLPTIKQLYSLIDFRGDSSAPDRVPYLDTDYFDFRWGDVSGGDRIIDAQYWSRTPYVGRTTGGDETAFGVNFADGRIKGYPTKTGPDGTPFARYARCVRDAGRYGINGFVDNGDGTVTDQATGLQWMKADNETPVNWEQALLYAESLELAGYTDWRLPNAKELQSIVDYSRAPDASDPSRRGPAIDPLFDVTETESWYWSGTTHLEGPGDSAAAYVAFGQAFGFMTGPTGTKTRLNVHGAGAQRSDPKSGDPADYEGGLGPQGDEIRIYNYVRAVRDAPEPPETPSVATPTVTAGPSETATPTGKITEEPSRTPDVSATPEPGESSPTPTSTQSVVTPTPQVRFTIYLPVTYQP